MLKYITIAAATLSLAIMPSMAQQTAPIGVSNSNSALSLAQTTASTLVVNMEVEVESVVAGEYARYAQQYLGVRASLVSKTTATIVSADISLAPSDFYIANEEMLSYGGSDQATSAVEMLPIDRTSERVLSVEEAAESAAAAIFKLRALRRDILSGELGEGFYGGGLAAALERMEYEERAYMELFFGRTEISRKRYTQYVTLVGDDARYMVCRFNPSEGVVDSSNLKAEPIMLQLTPSEQSIPDAPLLDSKSRSVVFRVSNTVKCDLYQSSTPIASKSIPLPEFGYDYTHVISPEK